jgi:hypothetical protein
MDSNDIEQVKSTTFLGIVINENLTWTDHIDVLINKTNKNLGIIRKLSFTLPCDVLYSLYGTLISPYFEYCNLAWASTNTTQLDKLNRIQKRAIRVITKSHWCAHTPPLFQSKGILKISDLNKLQVGCFVYKATHNILPSSFQNYFMLNSAVHEYSTRRSSNIHISNFRTDVRQHSIRLHGAKIWNSINIEIRQSLNINSFKRKYKSVLLLQYA